MNKSMIQPVPYGDTFFQVSGKTFQAGQTITVFEARYRILELFTYAWYQSEHDETPHDGLVGAGAIVARLGGGGICNMDLSLVARYVDRIEPPTEPEKARYVQGYIENLHSKYDERHPQNAARQASASEGVMYRNNDDAFLWGVGGFLLGGML